MKRGFIYLLVFAVVAIAAGAVALETSLALNVTRCDHREAASEAFLADCNAFGNYEHGAYFYGLEPEAVAHLRQADVVFLGDSHMQYAFSTPNTDAIFAARGLRHYLLGFGYGEGSAFAQALTARAGLRPRALIVNTNPYFSDVRAMPAERSLGRRAPLTGIEYRFKKRAIDFAKRICARFELACSGQSPAIYRIRANGHWRVGGFDTHQVLPLAKGTKAPSEAQIADAVRSGEQLIAAMHVAPSCIVLTGIPDGEAGFDASAFSSAIAARLGTKVLNVEVPDMRSIDGTHMTPDTAQRWSAAFFARLGPLLDDCATLRPR